MSHTLTSLQQQPSLEKSNIHKSVFDALPNAAFVRQSQLVQSCKQRTVPVPLPFSAPTLWRKVKAGTFPQPVKLSKRVTAWNVGEIRAWMIEQSSSGSEKEQS
jgi:predicted DNA-binding transcriptional regulator AlpA